MSEQHTPGPWVMHQPQGCAGYYFDSGAVQFYLKRTSLYGANEMDANARLIAAAPDLLAALEAIVQAMVDYQMDVDDPPPYHHCQMMDAARAAIAKAKAHA